MRLKKNKPKSICLRLTQSQYDYLDIVAKKADITINDLLRIYIDSIMINASLNYENNSSIK